MKTPRLLTLFAVLLFLAACSQSEDNQPSVLESQFGTRESDSVEDVAYSKNGHLYAIGLWDSTIDPRSESYNSYDQSQAPSDSFLRRYDSAGNLLWENYFDVDSIYNDWPYNYPHRIEAQAVTVDNGGNAIIAWSATYSDPVSQSVVQQVNYLSKYSPYGQRLWRISTNSFKLKDLALDGAGNIYGITGLRWANPGYQPGALAKYTSSGALVWAKLIPVGDFNDIEPTGVAVSSTNNIYTVLTSGTVEKFSSSGTKLWSRPSAFNGNSAKITIGINDEIFVVAGYLYDEYIQGCDASNSERYYYARIYKFSSSGIQQWYKNAASMYLYYDNCSSEYSGWGPEFGLNIDTDTLGNIYVTGGRSANADITQHDAFVAKYNRSGLQLWLKGFSSGSPVDGATSIATYDGSEIYVGAVTYGSLVHRNLGGSDAVLRKMDRNGNRIWTR